MFENLPAWGILILGVVYLAFQFVQKFLEKQEQKREAEARQEYREKREKERLSGHSKPSIPSVQPIQLRPSDDTGRHDLRSVLEDEREREQRLEILGNTRNHTEMMGHLVAAEARQTALLTKIVEMQEAQQRQQQQMAETQRAIVRYLRIVVGDGGGPPAPGATLREIQGFKSEGKQG
ncbi:MAG TPA: hypothetical protein ENK57_12230 [Polyangiaceae bacterium]|nr:hypothetical protein [Polyangiaceae bacterium]